jgi:hypothetical protein
MSLRFNPARGEAAATLGGVDLVIAVEMERLAQLQVLANVDDFPTLYARLIGFHLPTVRHALATLVLRGDAKAAAAALTLNDMAAWIKAISEAFAAHLAPPGETETDTPRPPQAAA